MTKFRTLLFIGVLLILAAGVTFAAANIQLQSTPDRFRLLIEDLRARSVEFTVEFAASLPTGERSRTFHTEPLRVGDDYFCFGESWNNAFRYHCTPFDNIISVTFIER